MDQTIDRPFLDHWDTLEQLEIQRRKGLIADDRHLMTLTFIEKIGVENFLAEARRVHAICQIARFYDNELDTEADLHEILNKVKDNSTHLDAFYYSFYFAAWIKPEVPPSQRRFSNFDQRIRYRVEEGGSLQSLLKDLVQIVGYENFRNYFAKMGINRVNLFLNSKNIESLDNLTSLDDLECQHLLDQLIMKTGLDQMKFTDVQKSVGHQPLPTDHRSWYTPLPCVPED